MAVVFNDAQKKAIRLVAFGVVLENILGEHPAGLFTDEEEQQIVTILDNLTVLEDSQELDDAVVAELVALTKQELSQ